MVDSPLCECGETQTIKHMVESCPITMFKGGLTKLHEGGSTAIKWLEELNTHDCSNKYDGAASMQGKYSGLKTRIQAENPIEMFTWCFAHKLNLVIVDTCDCCINTKTFFGNVGDLIEFMRARKRTAAFVVIQEKYSALLKPLENISKANDSDSDTTSTAKNLISVITSSQFILVLVLMRRIFSVTTEVSNYLQSKSIDFMQAIKMANVAKNRLKTLRTNEGCTEIINTAKVFSTKNNLSQYDFKIMLLLRQLTSGLIIHKTFFKDLSLLTPERMLSIKTKSELPSSAFEQLSNWIDIDTNKLQYEYLTFSNSFNDLFNDTYSTQTSKSNDKNNDRTDQPYISSEIDSDDSEIEDASTTKMFRHLGFLSSHNLIAAFQYLYLAYKALCIIPASSASTEQSFSKVKLVKSRLRSTIGQNRLESSLILSCERYIEIDRHEAIDIFAKSSELLMQNLLFK
ncbi:uncharacterized protein LOC103307868 [Acyrthosiphon pisum]|uniref:HAT C-terminal dimerisation domain-containing protein n=1 Tax=Acyrthosiphon pisum TaxID=7029 RepID=A0A8R1X0D3_ACYPI|nr:uncharacterized protein LOC103307868 [Acyrthosiphon pisum]|eukprot:XP_008178502.1 PREDICTED: uncharacterized protein LOC103307868 [Acyrthosiphon pisum]